MPTIGNGKFKYEFVAGWDKLPNGWKYTQVAGVAVDSQDRVYVYNRGEHPVIVYDREGNFLNSWGEGFLKHAHGIFIDSNDYVYLADRFMQTVLKFTTSGELLMMLGTKDVASKDESPFNHLTDVAVSPEGEIYVSDGYGNSRLHKFSPDGKLILSWGRPGNAPGQFKLPHSVWVDRRNRVLAADRENHRIQVFTTNGEFITQWTGLLQPCDLFVDSDDNLYVAELQSRVSILNLEGELLAQFGGEKSNEPGQFVAPHGIWTDSKGDLYVGEVLEGQRIQKFRRL